jgi:hypothetical protein
LLLSEFSEKPCLKKLTGTFIAHIANSGEEICQ